jgi:stringent starvation protein B
MTEGQTMEMKSSRPYLLRAIYEWIVDNDLTPYLLVNAGLPDVLVPMEYVNNGKIMLNISPHAVQDLDMAGDQLSFSARFNGKATYVSLPMSAALAIYAKENGRGMVFSEEQDSSPEPAKDKKGGPTLRIVK